MGAGGGATGYLIGGGTSALVESTGGIINTPGNGHNYHVFLYGTTDDFVAGSDINASTIDILLVGGGGAGGSYYGAGGGAGGVVQWLNAPITSGNTYTITVGAGGASAPPGTNAGGPGGNSSIGGLPVGTITALGGGGGQPAGNPGSKGPLGAGGSGGGSGSVPGSRYGGIGLQPVQNSNATPQPGFSQYGNPGGDYTVPSTGYAPAGGGGAGAGGGNGYQSQGAGAGGSGVNLPTFSGPIMPALSPVWPRMGPGAYYGGGGGAGGYATDGSTGGWGGGGNGHPRSGTDSTLSKGADGLGGGGGGRHPAGDNSLPTAGGHGICVIKYARA